MIRLKRAVVTFGSMHVTTNVIAETASFMGPFDLDHGDESFDSKRVKAIAEGVAAAFDEN